MHGRWVSLRAGLLAAGSLLISGCAARKAVPPSTPVAAATPAPVVTPWADERYASPVPTVPPATPGALPTRPVPNRNLKATKGHPIGPIITYFGAARADGNDLCCEIVLQSEGEAVVHVHLNGDQEKLAHAENRDAVHDLRRPPADGQAKALQFLENLRFTEAELDWVRASGRFSADFPDWLAGLRFTGEVHAMPEGTAFFADEPILRVTAPLPEHMLKTWTLLGFDPESTIDPFGQRKKK